MYRLAYPSIDAPVVDNNVDIESNWDKEVESFDDLNLSTDLLRGIYAYGFEKPSVIQQKAILPVLEGHDTIAQAQSGMDEAEDVILRNWKDCYFLHLCPSVA